MERKRRCVISKRQILFSPEFSRNFVTGPKLNPTEFSKLRATIWPFRVGFYLQKMFPQ